MTGRRRPGPVPVLLAVVAVALGGCSTASAPTPPASPTEAPSELDVVALGCSGLPLVECRAAAAIALEQLPADRPAPSYVEVSFGCARVHPCGRGLGVRPAGSVRFEFAEAEAPVTVDVRIRGNGLVAAPGEWFGVEVAPTSGPLPVGAEIALTLGHCGVWSGIDADGAWWDPVGEYDAGHTDFINAAEGRFRHEAVDEATFRTVRGLELRLVRHRGPKHLPLCS